MRERAREVGATLAREGLEFGVVDRSAAVGGQAVTLQGLRGRYDDVFLPLYGAHQAQNAAVALAAAEAFAGTEPLDADLVRAAFAEVTSPGRLEIVRRSPTIVLDAAHNPHGAHAVAEALEDSFQFSPLIGVMGVMADKDVMLCIAPGEHGSTYGGNPVAAAANAVIPAMTSTPGARDDAAAMQFLIPGWSFDNKKPCLVR